MLHVETGGMMAVDPYVVSTKSNFLREVDELDRLFSQALVRRRNRDAGYNLPRSVISESIFREIRARFLLRGWEAVRALPTDDPDTIEIRFRHPRSEWEKFQVGYFPHFDNIFGAEPMMLNI